MLAGNGSAAPATPWRPMVCRCECVGTFFTFARPFIPEGLCHRPFPIASYYIGILAWCESAHSGLTTSVAPASLQTKKAGLKQAGFGNFIEFSQVGLSLSTSHSHRRRV